MKPTVLITGASLGIGLECAKVFAEKDYDLVLVARNPDRLEALKEELERQYRIAVTVVSLDLAQPDAALFLLNHLNNLGITVDVLVNNAGLGDCVGYLDSSWDKQKNMIDLNITALMQMTYVFGNDMRRRGYGRILNLSSVAAFSAGPYMAVYYASKSFVLSFSQAVAEELKNTGVTVTALCPGPTATGFEAAAGMKGSKMFTAFQPATAEQVARAGVAAVMQGKVVKYHGVPTVLMNIGSRIASRRITRKFAGQINGVPGKGGIKNG